MKKVKAGLAVLLPAFLILMAAPETGCKTTLAPGGKYTDVYLYTADATAKTATDAMSAFLKWEKQNRATLPSGVVDAAKAIRVEYPKALQSYAAVRKAYIAAPAATGTKPLDAALAILSASVTEASKWLTNSPIAK